MNRLQLLCTQDDKGTALVHPPLDKDQPSYFEVRVETCDDECSIMVGIMLANRDRLKLVPQRFCAAQNAGGWLFNCKNFNLVHDSRGFDWIKRSEDARVKPASTVGVYVDPVNKKVHIYVDKQCLTPEMPLNAEARAALQDDSTELLFCVDLSHKSQSVIITNQPPSLP